ncbi:hypothetical protein BDW02DRAFT_196407 [Decorospora gaudefroyi]|uniref:Uncharacterized protein n=1 Tax=Decorospora gaudefroyi TaxID=184978 RepID=A0A6A5KRC9_9PLEO|nr:hypothetical protein BDW02DRAFT_196407 [Decorospora gaudefroyi]
MGDIVEYPYQQCPSHTPCLRKRADSLHPRTPTPPYARRSLDTEQQPHQSVISAYLRSSYYDETGPGEHSRFSSAEHHHSPSPARHSSQGEIRRLSGNFNAPTDIELERHRDHKRNSRSMGKLKNAVRGLVRA